MDLDAILDFVFSPDEQRSVDVQLEERYVPVEDDDDEHPSLGLIEKYRKELKSGEHEQHEAVRLNLITRLLDSVEQLDPTVSPDQQDSTLGEVVAYNTLIQYGFLHK